MSGYLRHRAPLPAISLYALMLCAACATATRTTHGPVEGAYVAYVANEASDLVSRVVFDAATGSITQHETPIGERGRIAGAHGVAVSHDGKAWYVALAHGMNGGRVAKYAMPADTLAGRVQVGAFPEDIAITPDDQYLYVANHDLHGAPGTISGISIIDAASMTEVARTNTCERPRGGTFNPAATSYYSVCSGSDQLVEIDTRTFHVMHRYSLTPGREGLVEGMARGARRAENRSCRASAIASGAAVRNVLFVLCDATNEVVLVDVTTWQNIARFKVPESAMGMAVDPAGALMMVAVSSDSSVVVMDAHTGALRNTLRTTQGAPHGIAISDDGKYAFVTNEGAGSARGSLDVFDAATLHRVATISLAYGPGSIDLLTNHVAH